MTLRAWGQFGHGLRRRLLLGCALAGAGLVPVSALAQVTLAPGTQVNANGGQPVVSQAGATTDITLLADRTILNWSSFNLGSTQTVVYRFQDEEAIVLNRVTGQAVVDGQIEALVGLDRNQGNVWFSAPGGVIIGPNARVNVGGLLATSAALGADSFLDRTNFSFTFAGAGSAQVLVRAGAQVKASGGALALVSGNVVTEAGSSVIGSGASTVLMGAATDFTVRFAAQPGDLDLLDFVVPAGGGTASAAPLTLQGQTSGANVFVVAVNRAEIASAVINAPGVIAAQSATSDRGDVVLTAGASVVNRQPGATRLNTTTETALNLGVVSAQRDLLGGFSSPTALSAIQLAAGRDMGLALASLNATSLASGRQMAVDAGRFITLNGASAGASASFRSTGAVNVGGGSGTLSAIGRLTVDAGSLSAGQLNATRSIAVSASGAGPNGAPAVSVNLALAGDDISIGATNAAGSIRLGAANFIGGAGTDEAPAGRNLILATTGATADVTFGAATGSPLTGATGVSITSGRDATISVSGLLTLTRGQVARTFTIRAQDLDITGPVTAANLRVESLQGAFTLGGGGSGTGGSGALAAALPGLRLTDAEFQRIAVTGQAGFYAGSAGTTERGDFQVFDLAVSPTRIPHLFLGAGGSSEVDVLGALAPTANGGDLVIGESDLGAPFRPGRILVSGSIGFSQGAPDTGFTGIRAFDAVTLNAGNDVILGSQRFIVLVAGVDPNAIDIDRNLPSGVAPTPPEQNHVYLTAGVLRMNAPIRIVQQNTGTQLVPNGLFLTNNAASPVDTLLTVSRAQVVDIFGALRDRNGQIRSGAGDPNFIAVDGGLTDGVRFNGLEVGATVTVLASATLQQASQVTRQAEKALEDNPTQSEISQSVTRPQPPLLAVARPELAEIISDPVTAGSGSDEIWRGKRKKPK